MKAYVTKIKVKLFFIWKYMKDIELNEFKLLGTYWGGNSVHWYWGLFLLIFLFICVFVKFPYFYAHICTGTHAYMRWREREREVPGSRAMVHKE